MFLHFSADICRHLDPKWHQNGLYQYVRYPHYTGEILMYSSLALLTGTLIGWIPLITSYGLILAPSMAKQEEIPFVTKHNLFPF